MRRSSPPKALLALLVALVPVSAAAEPLRFAWPVPGKAKVVDRAMKRGEAVVMSYQVSVAPAPDGKRLAVRLTEFEFLEVNGQNARTPAIRKQLGPALKMAAAIPTLIVGPDGAFQEITGMAELVAKLTASLPAAERSAVRQFMSSSQYAGMIQESSVQFWNVWVGMWIGRDMPPGRSREFPETLTLPDGSTVPRPLTVTNHGPAGPPGNVRLTFNSTLAGDGKGKLRSFMQSLMQEAAASSGKAVPPEQFQLGAISMSGEVVTDPATLQPATAGWRKRITVQLQGQPPQTSEEMHEYTFTWAKPAARKR